MVSSKLLKQFLAALVCYICSIGYYHETSSMQNLLVNIFIAEYVNSEFFVLHHLESFKHWHWRKVGGGHGIGTSKRSEAKSANLKSNYFHF